MSTDFESQLIALKFENEELKENNTKFKDTICDQAMTIIEMKNDREGCVKNAEHERARMKDVEEGLRLENSELKQKMEIEKEKYENEIAELKNTVKDQERKIKNLKFQLQSITTIKTDPDDDKKLLQDKIDELQLKLDKKIKELEAQLQTSEDEKKILQTSCVKFNEKIKELEAELESKTSIENNLRTKITQMKQQSDEREKLLESGIDKLKSTMKSRGKKILKRSGLEDEYDSDERTPATKKAVRS